MQYIAWDDVLSRDHLYDHRYESLNIDVWTYYLITDNFDKIFEHKKLKTFFFTHDDIYEFSHTGVCIFANIVSRIEPKIKKYTTFLETVKGKSCKKVELCKYEILLTYLDKQHFSKCKMLHFDGIDLNEILFRTKIDHFLFDYDHFSFD